MFSEERRVPSASPFCFEAEGEYCEGESENKSRAKAKGLLIKRSEKRVRTSLRALVRKRAGCAVFIYILLKSW